MSHAVYEMMDVKVINFLNHPGKRLPLDIRLDAATASPSQEDVRFVEDVTISGEAFAQLGTLYLDTRIRTTVERSCSRCLAPVHVPVDLRETFEVTIPAESATVDLSSQIMGFILASLDPHLLCRADCRGLCPVCGADLNQYPDHTCQDTAEEHPKLGDFLR